MATGGSTYNYRVIVDVEVNTGKSASGTDATEAYLKNIERQTRQTQQKITDHETQYARQRYDNKVNDYRRQLALTEQNERAIAEIQRNHRRSERENEIRDNQQAATSRANFHQQRFREMQANAEREKANKQRLQEEINLIERNQNRISLQNEIRDNQLKAAEHHNYHVQRFRQMQAAYNNEASEQQKHQQTVTQSEKEMQDKVRAFSNASTQTIQNNLNAQARAYEGMASAAESAYKRVRQASAGAGLGAGASQANIDATINTNRPFKNTAPADARPRGATPGAGATGARGDIQILDSYIDKSDRLNASTTRGANALDMWGRAFKGAFVGAIAGMAFSTVISGITGIYRVVGQLTLAAIEAGAKFQTTTKALEVFAGTTARARQELADIGETARSTAGLRLADAEVGYTRLRALGFEATQARAFIKELGEEKILSGASDEALQRIIFNFAQIASGGQKVSQELREILTQMPSMRNAFIDAFGTLDPKKIQAFFDKDTESAFKRLTDAMARQRAANGGLEDSFGKLQDELIRAGRSFADPILDPLTTSVQGLTQAVKNNESSWKALGETVADVITSINNTPLPSGMTLGGASADALGTTLFGNYWGIIKQGASAYRQVGGAIRQQQVFNKPLEELGFKPDFLNRSIADPSLFDLRRQQYNNSDFTDDLAQLDFSEYLQRHPGGYPELDTFENRLNMVIQKRNRLQYMREGGNDEQKRLREAEKLRQEEVARIDSYYSQIRSIRESAFAIEAAQVQDNAEKTFRVTDANFAQQIGEVRSYYAQKIALSEGQDTEIIKLSIERDNEIRRIETEQAVARINFDREQARIRREALIESNNLFQREIEKSFDVRERELQRSLDRGNVGVADGYDEMIDIVRQRENVLTEQIRAQYALRLQDKSLTDQQIINLEKERDLEIADLQDRSLVRTREIEDARNDALIKNIQFQREIAQENARFLTNLSSQFQQDFFNPDTFSSASMRNFNEGVMNRSRRQELQKQIDEQLRISREVNAALLERDKGTVDSETLSESAALRAPFIEKIDKAEQKIGSLNAELNSLSERLPKDYEKFVTLANGIGKNADAFDRLNEAILAHRQERERVEANKEVEYWKDLIKVETDSNKVKEYRLNLLKAENNEQEIFYRQGVERAEQYRQSLAGINEEIALLASGDTQKLGALRYLFDKGQGEAVKDTLTQIRMLEFELASPEINAQYEQRLAILTHIRDIRKEEAEALTRIQIAEIDIQRQFEYSETRANANFAEFLASQKGITEIVSDARINALTTAYDGLDMVAQSLTKNFGLAGKAVQQLLADLLKLSLNWFVQKFMGGGQTSGGNFNLMGSRQGGGGFQLPNIFGGGQGGGIFSTPPFNPNAGTGIGSNWLDSGIGNYLGGGQISTSGTVTDLLGRGVSTQTAGNPGGTGASSLIGMLGAMANPATMLAAAVPLFIDALRTTSPVKGALQGGLVGLVASFINRSRLRRKEEKVRNQAMVDAFRQIDDLIDRVNRDIMDGQSALASADQIRASYVESMSQLTDKKTRNIALKDVSRIDLRISQLKDAVQNQKQRQERLAQSIPTFGDGGNVSRFIGNNFQNNPLGYQAGGQSFGYFPSAGIVASYNERGNEYIFDAETTRNVGVRKFDAIRATKGKILDKLNIPVPQMFGGGNVPTAPVIMPSSAPVQTSPQIGNVIVNFTLGADTFVEVFAEMLNSSGEKQVKNLTTEFRNGSVQELTDQIIAKLREKKVI